MKKLGFAAAALLLALVVVEAVLHVGRIFVVDPAPREDPRAPD